MVRKFLDFLYKGFLHREINSLNQAAFLLGLFSVLSQIIGFLRDRLLASIFGVGSELDVYYSAFRIPDFLFVSVASVVSLSVLIPFIIEKDSESRESLRKFIDSIFSFFSLLIIAVAILTYFLMPFISQVLFKGMSPNELTQVVFISRLLLLSPIILGLSNLFGSLTQAYNRFIIYALAPILYNAGIVIGILLFSKGMGVVGVALGVILGAILHLVIQVPFVWKAGLMPRLSLKPDWKIIEKVAKISIPRTLTLSMSAITFIFLVALAARMVNGSVSILSFSWNLQTISLSIIGVSYSLAAFPTLSRKFQEKNIKEFVEQMEVSARFIIFWSLPLTALLVVLRAQIVRVLLGSGLFDWSATRLTAAALALFVISSVFQSLLLLFMRGFYSAGFTKKPFFINLISNVFLIIFSYELVNIFYASNTFHYFITTILKVEDLPGSAVLMLPLGFTLGTIINGILLWIAFEWEFRGFSRGVMRAVFEGLGSSFILGGMTYVGLQIFATFLPPNTVVGIFLQGFLSGMLGIVAAIIILLALKSRELLSVWSVIRGKFWKTKVIATDPEIV
ncbi:MAG: lipid II flippase MurJ [Patescibacteria group bacterium]